MAGTKVPAVLRQTIFKTIEIMQQLCYNTYTPCVLEFFMEIGRELVGLRKQTGMNRREFAEYFGIPYRTVQDWELGNRQMPEYLYRLMAYKVAVEGLEKEQT
jgi:DNA-binding transcriptional regulator YiaG